MNAPAMTLPRRSLSTPHQRMYARTLMRQLDLPTHRTTLLHRRFFEAVQIAPPEAGVEVDAVLCALTKVEISMLIGALKEEVSDEA